MPPGITPAQKRLALNTNYLDFTGDEGGTFAQQYLPELYEQEVERYGNRTLSGFLRMVGAEMPMTSDQVVWSEQNRLHIAYKGATIAASDTSDKFIQVTIDLGAADAPNGAIRPGATILLTDAATGLTSCKALAQTVTPANDLKILDCTIYEGEYAGVSEQIKEGADLFVYGSEFGKGSTGMDGTIQPQFTQYSNSPIILKDNFEINGSDTAQIGWVEVATEDGTSGYLWYMKAESETRLRYEDYLEMAMVEGELAVAGSGASAQAGVASTTASGLGTQGMFAALEDRGNVYQGFAGAANPGSGALEDFDAILEWLDFQGAIEENMLFLDRSMALDFDDMIGAMAGGGYNQTNAASYGLFDNEAEIALNFGF